MKKLPSLAIWLIALGLLAVLPQVFTSKYYIHLSVLALIWVIMAQGQNLIQGYTGYVSIVGAGFMGIGAYSSTLLGLNFQWPIWATMAFAPLITALFALATGYPSLRVKGHYFAIVTLAFNLIIVIVLINYSELTKGEMGISGIPKPWGGDRVSFFYLALALAAILTLLAALIARSRVGEILLAIRQNEDLVGSIGIAAWKYKLFAFVVSAMYAGVAGALYAHYQGFINPEIFGVAQSLDAILAVILGGSGTIAGPVIGAFLVVFLPEILRFADSFRLILYGLILVLATIFMPIGIVGIFKALLKKLTRKSAPHVE